MPDFKEDDRALVKWYENQLKDTNIAIHFNTKVTKDLIDQSEADVIIVATGSTPKMLKLNNMDKVYTAQDVLLGNKNPGNSTVIIGGGLVGCETALWLVQQGKKVTIVEALDDILASGPAICHANSQMLRDLLTFYNVEIKTKASITSVNTEGAIIKHEDKEITIPADSIILSVGYTSEKSLYNELRYNDKEMYLLGDAREVKNIMTAIWDAYEVARNI